MKRCSKCKQVRPFSQFRKNVKAKDGHGYWCKICCSEYQKQYPEQRKQRYRRNQFPKKYGITPALYEELLDAQEGKCAICKTIAETNRYLCVDHDHKLEEVRGLLCDSCNLGIGKFQDNPYLLEAAARYLREYE